jgi:hypothetical protein
VLFGAWLAFPQFSQQQQTAQSQIKQQQQAARQQQQQAARDLLICNQVSKGFEQLASDKMAMRLGGIYALEGVMNASERPEQYRGPVLEMLCAFVLEYTIGKTVFEKPAIDIQAALMVIGRRKGQELPDSFHEADIRLPNINCEKCTLQIIFWMGEHALNRDGDYSYHHCANLLEFGAKNISAVRGTTGQSEARRRRLHGATTSRRSITCSAV